MIRFIKALILLLLAPAFLAGWLLLSEKGLQLVYQQAKPYLPTGLSLQQIEGRLSGPLTITAINYQQNDMSLHADKITVNWNPLALMTANIEISELSIQTLKITLPATATNTSTHALADITLAPRITLRDVSVRDVLVQKDEQTYSLEQISLEAKSLLNQVTVQKLFVSRGAYRANIEGQLNLSQDYSHDLSLSWEILLPTHIFLHGNGRLKGDLKQTQLQQKFTGPLTLALDATFFDLTDALHWHAQIEATQIIPAQLALDMPELNGVLTLDAQGDINIASISGTLNGNFPETGPVNASFDLQRLATNTIRLNQLQLHASTSETDISASGQWQPDQDSGVFDLSLNWTNLRWPLHNTPWFNSVRGNGTIRGKLDQYQLELETSRPWQQAPVSQWHAIADGNLDGLLFHRLHITTLDGEVIATGPLNWSPQLNWQAKVNASNINPASVLPEWPGKLNASLTSRGQLTNTGLIVDTEINKITGKLRGYPVSLTSRLRWENNNLDVNQFIFRSAQSELKAHGRAGNDLDLNWSVKSPDLATLYPQAQGQLRASGILKGPYKTPSIQAAIEARSLAYPGYAIADLNGKLAIDLRDLKNLTLDFTAHDVSLRDKLIQSLHVTADAHQLSAKATTAELATELTLRGQFEANHWRGQVVKASVQSPRFDNWQIKTPVNLEFDSAQFKLEQLCWHNSQQASICTLVEREENAWKVELQINQSPLDLLSPLLAEELQLNGLVDASLQLQFVAPDQLTGQAQLKLHPGQLSYPLFEGQRDQWNYSGGESKLLINQDGITASAMLTMSNGDHVNSQLIMTKANLLKLESKQPLQLKTRVLITDLGIIEALAPEVHDAKGKLALALDVAGTLAKPGLTIHAQLDNGSLRVPRLGLQLDQLNLQATSTDNKLDVIANVRSGEGTLTLKSQTTLDKTAGWPTTASIKGEQFEVSRIPEARVLVSPDLQVNLQDFNVNLTGIIHIPFAKLQPKDISSAAQVSSDTVIVNGEQIIKPTWTTKTKIRLTLGERINFFGFGFEGRLGGSLLLQDEPGQLTTATGEINIPEGRYRAYGQRLDVEHGRLLYTGGPLTNPGLDLRAVRHINGVVAGLKVRGSLSQPQLDLFSIPAMGQTDALSYLVLGRPMESSTDEDGAIMAKAALALGISGGDQLARMLGEQFGLDEMRVESNDKGDQASLVIGRYLSPRLYVSYGVGLIEAFNTFTVRYQISDKWQLKAESGEFQGADILYSIER